MKNKKSKTIKSGSYVPSDNLYHKYDNKHLQGVIKEMTAKEPIARLEELVFEDKPLVILSKEVQHQIQWLHANSPKGKEWCGILLYKVRSGDINDAANLIIDVKGLFFMDIGSEAFTSYTAGGEVVQICKHYPEYIDENWSMGLIHTHHTMDTFFSGTDLGELHDSAPSYNYFLSLIVNYKNEYIAKIATVVTETSKSVEMVLTNGKKSIIELKTKQFLGIFDCTIESEVSSNFKDRFNAVKASIKPSKVVKTSNKIVQQELFAIEGYTPKYLNKYREAKTYEVYTEVKVREFLSSWISMGSVDILGEALAQAAKRWDSMETRPADNEAYIDFLTTSFDSVAFKLLGHIPLNKQQLFIDACQEEINRYFQDPEITDLVFEINCLLDELAPIS